jgi:hypothetical protein
MFPKQLNFVTAALAHYGHLHPSICAIWHLIQTRRQNTKKNSEQGLELGFHFHSHQAHYKLRMSKLPSNLEEELQYF